MGTIAYTDDLQPTEQGEDLVIKWNLVNFTDEKITRVKWDYGFLFATTVSGIVWVSSDRGKTWKTKSEASKYFLDRRQYQKEDLLKSYERSMDDVNLQYHRLIKRLNGEPVDWDITEELP